MLDSRLQAMAQRTIGFRFVALVTGNDTSPSYVAAAKGQQGTEHLGMLFRVNGAALFARGANMIPMEELEGRLDAQAHRVLVQSAAAARFNIFRFWGGGMFLPDAWYDECDKAGIMVCYFGITFDLFSFLRSLPPTPSLPCLLVYCTSRFTLLGGSC